MKDDVQSSIGPPAPPPAPAGPPPEVAVQVSATAVTCPYCRGDLAEAVDLACAGCGTTLHRSCWRECRTCPTVGCGTKSPLPPPLDRHVRTKAERDQAAAAFLSDSDAQAPNPAPQVVSFDAAEDLPTLSRLANWRLPGTSPGFGQREWFEGWVVQDPITRAVELARNVAGVGLFVLPILFAMGGSVMLAPDQGGVSLLGAFQGALWGIPAAFGFAAYAFVQGLVGVRATKLRNGGLATLFTAVAAGFAVVIAADSTVLAVAVGLMTAALGGRVFGFHIESSD